MNILAWEVMTSCSQLQRLQRRGVERERGSAGERARIQEACIRTRIKHERERLGRACEVSETGGEGVTLLGTDKRIQMREERR